MHALRPASPLHQLESSHVSESYHKKRILDYINNINPAHWPETDITIPSSSPSDRHATKSRNLTYADGLAYREALISRKINVVGEIPPSYGEPNPDYELPSTLTAPTEVENSLRHAYLNRIRAVGLATLRLSMPFFVTEWLIDMPELKYHVSMHFKTEPLKPQKTMLRPLNISDPDIVVGYNWKSIRGDYKLAFDEVPDSLRFAFPIVLDTHFAFPFFSIEMRSDAEQGPSRNLHLAALMLRGLGYFHQKAYGKNDEADKFDGKVRVLTATISRNDVNVFGHWTNGDPGDPKKEEFYAARHGLETLCKWMMKENRKWIAPGLQELAKA
ncbi:hypothetical protein BO85DRAFT_503521 [Aspergillus piperis CBS 112811]|uniref:DUF7924 domain-containing protein n=1 Tax=Aspergillus piperis CBS 112811 TaxID=1448313 RepID=A0A8G1QUD3_9EURO|nr:hypothetical protein BO85DRAFT_503521 [Aspergillus piperis CBS 112811]RAH53998.1 hypothetical protein BO85DRAFT_503521 [Aspergillus piperis CBS 112811]